MASTRKTSKTLLSGFTNLQDNVMARLVADNPPAKYYPLQRLGVIEVIVGLSSHVCPPSIQFHEHVISLDLDGKAPHSFVGEWSQGFAGFDIELRIVPGAGDDLLSQFALA